MDTNRNVRSSSGSPSCGRSWRRRHDDVVVAAFHRGDGRPILVACISDLYNAIEAGGRERGRPTLRGGVSRDERLSPSTWWGCSRTGPAFIAVEMTRTGH